MLEDNHLTRFDWQVLHTVYQAGSIPKAGVFEVLRAFVNQVEFDQIVEGFVQKGWLLQLERDEARTTILELTDAGKTGHGVIFELQKEVRKRASQGVSEEEYTAVIGVLQRMVDNLAG